jgi:hypothetical protein
MGLRDQNPIIDADLELIISSYEKAVVKSNDLDSVFVPFRRELESISNYPSSVISSIDQVPLATPEEEAGVDEETSGVPDASVTPESVAGEPETPIEEGSEDDDWTEKAKDWVADCIPCLDDYQRVISSMSADFYKDLGVKWGVTLKETWDKLQDLESLLSGADMDLVNAFCDLGDALKIHCIPDLKRMVFVLTSFLDKMQTDLRVDLSVLDSFLTSALAPVFNEFAANLDLLGDLAINPIRCTLDFVQFQVNNATGLAEAAASEVVDPVIRFAYEKRMRLNEARRAAYRVERAETLAAREVRRRAEERETEEREASSYSTGEEDQAARPQRTRSEAEILATRARLEEEYQEYLGNRSQMQNAIQRASQAFDRAKNSLSYLERFKHYLTEGADWLEDKKTWLLELIEEFINTALDRWNDNISFARGKKDILTMVSILMAMIEAAKNGDLSCGSETDALNEDDVSNILRYWTHPAESLEIIFENGNIVTRRLPSGSTDSGSDGRGESVSSGDKGADRVTSLDLENVVLRRPISSCLKKITTEEADQVEEWIRQLEQEV